MGKQESTAKGPGAEAPGPLRGCWIVTIYRP
jgi:hypothetical protein